MKTHTAVDELKRCLGNIERFDEQVNAFITVLSDTALEEAQQADEEFAGGGGKGLLAGVPISVKDCIDVAGVRCTNGSLFFKDYVPERDALIIQRLRRAGAVIVGKTNLHEFAYGSTTCLLYTSPSPRDS